MGITCTRENSSGFEEFCIPFQYTFTLYLSHVVIYIFHSFSVEASDDHHEHEHEHHEHHGGGGGHGGHEAEDHHHGKHGGDAVKEASYGGDHEHEHEHEHEHHHGGYYPPGQN